MKRELKVAGWHAGGPGNDHIARPIPMKRELKVDPSQRECYESYQDCKAHPDEKGTESRPGTIQHLVFENCKAHPDEKGTERSKEAERWPRPITAYCKAHPDEKGTESLSHLKMVLFGIYIARPIPMKRELKGLRKDKSLPHRNKIARPIPMKRELKAARRCPAGGQMVHIARPIPMKRELKDIL